jgi:thiamine biosynthesis lipoprotein ApbE
MTEPRGPVTKKALSRKATPSIACSTCCASNGATHAVINFGGQIGTLTSTAVTIADPKHRDRPVVALTLNQRSLSTSSTSEKPNHIIDPRSGRPVPARGSVSVIHDSALIADILSTALYVMGREQGLAWARAHGVTAIFIDNDSIEASAAVPGIRLLDAHFKLKD